MDQLIQALESSSLDPGKSLATEGSHVQPGAEMNKSEGADMEEKETSVKSTDSTSKVDKWVPTPEWISSWKNQLPLQTVMRMLQVYFRI